MVLATLLLLMSGSGCRAFRANTTSFHPAARATYNGASWFGALLVGGPVAIILLPISLPVALITEDTHEDRLGVIAAPWIVGKPFGWIIGGVVTAPVVVGSLPFAPEDEELLEMIRSGSPGEQIYAVQVAAELNVEGTLFELQDLMLFGAEPSVEVACIDAMTKLLPPEEVPQMLVDRLSALYVVTRVEAIGRLEDRRERAATVALIRLLHEIQPPPVREAAHEALVEITGRELPARFGSWVEWWEAGQEDYPEQLLPSEIRDTPRWPESAFE